MAGNKSRDLLIKQATTRLAGITSKSINVAKEPIDVSSDEDNGYRILLSEAGTKTLDLSFSGVTKDNRLRSAIMTEQSQLLTDIEIEWPPTDTQTTGDKVTGDFYFNGYTSNGASPDGALEFDGTMQSSGEWTYTEGTAA